MKWIENSIGRRIPEEVNGVKVKPFKGAFASRGGGQTATRTIAATEKPGRVDKVLPDWDTLLNKLDIKDGMVISFHHHLRNGDLIVNEVMKRLRDRGLKDLVLAPSALFPCHEFLVDLIKDGTISHIEGSMNGPIGRACSHGQMKKLSILRSHGGRYRAIQDGDLKIDVAFLAAPTADPMGNATGVIGKSACGPMLYALPDSLYANKVAIITDNLVPYPCIPWSIQGGNVDYVLKVDSIGDPSKIVSGTTRLTKSPTQLLIAEYTAQFIEEAGIMKDGFSFQAGAGGISLAATVFLADRMRAKGVKASFTHGGATQVLVDLLEEGLVNYIIDLQSFDLGAVRSCRENANHVESSPFTSYNHHARGSLANMLDVAIMGATEVDINYNANVNTHSDGLLLHGTGGHSDGCAGAGCTIITAPSFRKRMPIIKDKVTTVTTPGEVIDVIVTERGIAINPKRKDLLEQMKNSDLPIKPIEQIMNEVHEITGVPDKPKLGDKPIAVIEWRDGTIIDTVMEVLD